MASGPWWKRVRRWGQTNITELDPPTYDLEFWRAHWRKTKVQGLIVNAGGIVAYYPSALPHHRPAEFLGQRDLFGDVLQAARAEGLAVLARMDSNRPPKALCEEHPDWLTRREDGRPYARGEHIEMCINGGYYRIYLPDALREIATRYRPEGFTDNNWSGMSCASICYCANCREKFRQDAGLELPTVRNWHDPAFCRWIDWSYACRMEVWDLNTRVAKEAGGPECLWLGMTSADPVGTARVFRDLFAIGQRTPVMMCDHQFRSAASGFEQNALNGKLLHDVAGPDALIPESMGMYMGWPRAFRVSANPAAEARLWMLEGIAGGISPWWHHIGARQADRRQFATAEAVTTWHADNEQYLYDREPVATVGVAWSRQNIDFYGRDDGSDLVDAPWRGTMAALVQARIQHVPLHLDHLPQWADRLAVLVLPNLAVLSDEQLAHVRAFVAGGGSVIASGPTSARDAWGQPRGDLALADIFGVQLSDDDPPKVPADHAQHTYLRLTPELNQSMTAPPPAPGQRHPVLAGLDETDLVSFGGALTRVRLSDGAADARVLATFVPAFPIFPPEFCWMRTPRTDLPAIVARELASGGRIVYFAADLDRCFGKSRIPDHGRILANAVRWAAREQMPVTIEGPGYLDCHLYRQGNRRILHIINLTDVRAWPAYAEEHLPVGPINVTLHADASWQPASSQLRVAGGTVPVERADGNVRLRIPSVAAHEMVVVE